MTHAAPEEPLAVPEIASFPMIADLQPEQVEALCRSLTADADNNEATINQLYKEVGAFAAAEPDRALALFQTLWNSESSESRMLAAANLDHLTVAYQGSFGTARTRDLIYQAWVGLVGDRDGNVGELTICELDALVCDERVSRASLAQIVSYFGMATGELRDEVARMRLEPSDQ